MPKGVYNHYLQNPVERFWRYVDKKDDTECWHWTASLTKGYGSFKTELTRYAHRFSFFLHHPYTSTDIHICHTCDNPKCVNPYHLTAGSHSDNMADMKEKGRGKGGNSGKSGCNTNRSKLSQQQVDEIRILFGSYKRGDDAKIAEKYGVSRKTINALRLGKSYTV